MKDRDLVLFTEGTSLWVWAFGRGMRFLFFLGKPIGEPVTWLGPIVMNTCEELRQVFREIDEGSFIRS